MRRRNHFLYFYCGVLILLTSCSSLEKASTHGLNSGYYKMKSQSKKSEKVYLEVTNEQINVHHCKDEQPELQQFLSIPLIPVDSLSFQSMLFKKQSIDIDITSILLKYRPALNALPAQLTSDLNMALYAGWRHDYYLIKKQKNPFGKINCKINTRGFDIGVFAGPGATLVSPFTTANRRADEYSALIIQTGIAGFIETNMASFGLAIGYDYLLNANRKIWIYRNQPWIGFVVGVALNPN